jgi:hypothetical protein
MTGHIRRCGERSWELKFDTGIDPLTGKRLTRYHSFKGRKKEAEAELIVKDWRVPVIPQAINSAIKSPQARWKNPRPILEAVSKGLSD